MNSGLSPDFSVQLKVSLIETLSKRLSQKVKSPIVATATDLLKRARLRNDLVCVEGGTC